MNTYILENAQCLFTLAPDGWKNLRSRRADRQFTLGAVAEFELQVDCDGCQAVVSPGQCRRTVEAHPGSIHVLYEHNWLTAAVRYTMENAAVYKSVQVMARRALQVRYMAGEIAMASLPLSRGGEGQPVFLGDVGYVGSLFPAAENGIDGGTLLIRQAPFVTLRAGEAYSPEPILYALDLSGSLEESVRDLVAEMRPHAAAPLRVYCDWGAHDELSGDNCEPLSEAMARRLLQTLQRQKAATGVAFDYYLMDAHWFSPEHPYTRFQEALWPQGPQRFLQELEHAGMRFGLWFDVNLAFVEGVFKHSLRGSAAKEVCLADPANIALLFDAVEQQMRDCRIKMIKFDFAYFDCACREHTHHALRPVASKEPAVRLFIERIRRLRQLDPEIYILGYNGFTTKLDYIGSIDPTRTGQAISPWWARDLDYLYCGDPRPSEVPCAQLAKSILYYSDCMVEQFHDALLPYAAIDDHGTIVGSTSTIYYLGKAALRNSWILNIARGGCKVHLYGELDLLEGEDWQFLRDTQSFFAYVCRLDCRTRAILQPPSGGGIYGYSNSRGNDGYFTLVNSGPAARHATVRLPEWAGTDALTVRRLYTAEQWQPQEPVEAGEGIGIHLEPDEVAVFYWERQVAELHKGYLRLDAGQCVCLRLPAACTRVGIRFITGAFVPLRGENGERRAARATAEGARLVRLHRRAVWSGISWQVYEVEDIVGESYTLCFSNETDEPIDLKWQQLAREGRQP